MIIKCSTILYCLVLITSLHCHANSNVISIGVAHFPPYSIVENDTISGAEVEIVKESLSLMGYNPTFVSYPYGRLPVAFNSKTIDGTIVTLKNFTDKNVFYSDIVLREYQTVAVHLNKNNFTISSITDLKEKSILAHQRANLFYGDEFKLIADTSTEYKETAHQNPQVLSLFRERVDVIVLAHEIFMYFKKRADYIESDKPFVVSKIFGEKFGFHNAFWNEKIRNDFNKGLALIKKNGTYHSILEQYLETYEPVIQQTATKNKN